MILPGSSQITHVRVDPVKIQRPALLDELEDVHLALLELVLKTECETTESHHGCCLEKSFNVLTEKSTTTEVNSHERRSLAATHSPSSVKLRNSSSDCCRDARCSVPRLPTANSSPWLS